MRLGRQDIFFLTRVYPGLLLLISLMLGLLWGQLVFAQTHTLDLRSDAEDVMILQSTKFVFVLDGEEIRDQLAQNVQVSLSQDDIVLAAVNMSANSPDFLYRFSLPGTYDLNVKVIAADGELVEKTFSFRVAAKASDPEEIARGVLILSIAGGVLLAFTIGFVIVLQGRHKKQRLDKNST
ncbi:MAG: hypothetical protein H6760_02710 [Candidatus Nomurabacteria bacterium]|nr:MAG: hypothetical protein H6760_02710 [Candidatus Nomurabacteria bacterium]